MILLALLVACGEMVPPVTSPLAATPGHDDTVRPPVADTTPGSLWSEVQARALIGMDGNARRIGDLITVLISDSSTTSLGADTTTSRDTSDDFHIDAGLGVTEKILKANTSMGSSIQLGGGSSTSQAGTGTTTRNGTLDATVTCQVVEVLANGNLRVRGRKQIKVNNETTYLTLEGVVRPRDILLDNTVRSDLIADANVEYTGAGVLAKDQHAGWATAAAETLFPF